MHLLIRVLKNPIARASPNPQGLQGPIPWQQSNGNTNRTAIGFTQPQRPKTGDHLRATPNSYDQTVTQSIQQNNLSFQQVIENLIFFTSDVDNFTKAVYTAKPR